MRSKLFSALIPAASCLLATTLATSAVVPVTDAAAAPVNISVMSYNVLVAEETTGQSKSFCAPQSKLAWSRRAPQVAAWVKYEKPSIIGFQENHWYKGGMQFNTLIPRLPEYTFITYSDDNGIEPKWYDWWIDPIAYRTSIFDQLDHGRIKIATKGEKGVSFDRFAAYALLKEKRTEREILVINTHLTAGNGKDIINARALQLKRIAAYAKSLKAKYPQAVMVATGDFNDVNTASSGRAKEALKTVGLLDTYNTTAKVNSRVPGAVSSTKMSDKVNGKCKYGAIKRAKSNWHIDYVFAQRNTNVISWRISSGPGVTKKNNVYYFSGVVPSDHAPVIATLQFNSNT